MALLPNALQDLDKAAFLNRATQDLQQWQNFINWAATAEAVWSQINETIMTDPSIALSAGAMANIEAFQFHLGRLNTLIGGGAVASGSDPMQSVINALRGMAGW